MSYTILNESGEKVTTTSEVREHLRFYGNVLFIGGSEGSYILLTDKDYDSIEIVAEYVLGDCNELYNEQGDYWYNDENNPEHSYCTFGNQFCVLEFWDIKKLKEEIKKVGV